MKPEKLWRCLSAGAALCFFASAGAIHALGDTSKAKAPDQRTAAERNGDLQLQAARQNPLQLRQFLKKMPKGADLHYHLSGGVYAESYIRWAVQDGLCADTAKLALTKCSAAEDSKNLVPASEILKDQSLYDALVDSFSMRSFVPSAGISAHDHFFATFGKFGGSDAHQPEWVDEVATRAAAQNEQYMELMVSPDYAVVEKIAKEIAEGPAWHNDRLTDLELARLRDEFRAHDLKEESGTHDLKQNVQSAIRGYEELEQNRRAFEHCGQPGGSAACLVDTRYICQVPRGKSQLTVFGILLLCFEAATADPERIVGLNLVQPEDAYVPMHDYGAHMSMVKYLHGAYPKVHISLHAGELAFGLVPPEGLCCHIRGAVEAGAERIGHGVDVMYENRPHELLKEMAAKHVMVEINLTSNDMILGVSGKNHPFLLYRMFGVPVALSTDDEGVSRIDLTNEYARAVETYGLSYLDVKNMVRTGLEHAFLPGASLWEKRDDFTRTVADCANDKLAAEKPSKSCADFLNSSQKAKQQWELERRFHAFESEF